MSFKDMKLLTWLEDFCEIYLSEFSEFALSWHRSALDTV